MTPHRILVTGGAGFIGSALVRRAVADGHHLLNLDLLTYAASLAAVAPAAASDRYELVQGDVCDAALVRATFARFQPTHVVHLAAESHVDRSIDGPAVFVRTNVVGTCTLLEEAQRYWRASSAERQAAFRFVHVSTDEVFGSLGAEGRFDEASPYRPNSPYAASKAAADHFARAWFHTYGLPVITTNCTNNYGPYQFPEKLIPLTIQRALALRSLPVYGDGGNVRDWLYVEDHVDALLRVAASGVPGETYAIGGRAERRNVDVVRGICAILDRLVPDAAVPDRAALIELVADRPGHDRRYAMDTAHIERALGWAPRESFESGLERTVQWYLAHREWSEGVQRSAGYDAGRLGRGVVA